MAKPKASQARSSKPSAPSKPARTPVKSPVAAPDAPEAEYTLAVLLARTGPSTRAEALAHLGAHESDALVAAGRRADTRRISRDAQRLYGRALDFHARATPEQRVLLGAVTSDRLRVGVWAAAEGDRLDVELSVGSSSAGQQQTSARAKWQTLRALGIRRRDLLRAAAAAWLGATPGVDDAYGTIRTAAQLAASLRALTKLVRACVTSTQPAMVALTHGTAITPAWLDTVDALADDVQKVGTSAESTRIAATVSQGEVDLWDGINLTFLARLIDTFDAAHAEDAAVPRLIPISLRSLLGASHRAAPAATPVTPPTP